MDIQHNANSATELQVEQRGPFFTRPDAAAEGLQAPPEPIGSGA